MKPKRTARPTVNAKKHAILGRSHDANVLPKLIIEFEQFKAGAESEVPDLPFMLLSALPLSQNNWVTIAKNASWQTTRMNLNTFVPHGAFEAPGLASLIAARLRDAGEIERSRVFPYQLLTAYRSCDAAVPEEVRNALQDAIELAIANVPSVAGQVVVCPDVSGSMRSPVTGHRRGSTSTVQCVDVAALVAASVLRKNSAASVLPFEQAVVPVDLNSHDSVMTNAGRLASNWRRRHELQRAGAPPEPAESQG